jgi:hypothetical protein
MTSPTLRGALAGALLLATAAPAAALWIANSGDGYLEAFVYGEDGALLNVTCGAELPGRPAGFYLDPGRPLAGPLGQDYLVTLSIDGGSGSYPMRLKTADLLEFEALDPAGFATLQALVASLGTGQRLEASAPALGWQDGFSLVGAAEALGGLLEPCTP